MEQGRHEDAVARVVLGGELEKPAGMGMSGNDREPFRFGPIYGHLHIFAGPGQRIRVPARARLMRNRHKVAHNQLLAPLTYARAQQQRCRFQPVARKKMRLQSLVNDAPAPRASCAAPS